MDSLQLPLSAQLLALTQDQELEEEEKQEQEQKPEREQKQELRRVVEAVRSARQEQYPYLEHPGQIFYLKRSGEGKTRTVFQQVGDAYKQDQ